MLLSFLKSSPKQSPRSRQARRGHRKLSFEYLEARDVPATFLVTTTADNGDNVTPTPSSLRLAILDANQLPGTDTIAFNIVGTGVQTIAPGSALPSITDAVTIDGYSQPGSSVNTLATGNNAIIQIELNGSAAVGAVNGLTITAAHSTVTGLAINRFGGSGIFVSGAAASNNTVQGNYIGLNAAGTADLGNTLDGVRIELGASSNTIGGSSIAARNLISGNNSDGIEITGTGTTGNVVAGNYIGTNAAGTAALSNSINGVNISGGATLNRIGTDGDGTSDTEERNIISGNTNFGVEIQGVGTDQNVVAGNFLGVNGR